MYGKIAVVAIVGNGAHKISADVFQALNDIGFTIPAGGATYWNAEVGDPKDYKDLPETPEKVSTTTRPSRRTAHTSRASSPRTTIPRADPVPWQPPMSVPAMSVRDGPCSRRPPETRRRDWRGRSSQ